MTAMGRKARPAAMTAKQFKEALEKLGMTQVELSERLGISDRHISGYATGRHPIPRTVKVILDNAMRFGPKFVWPAQKQED